MLYTNNTFYGKIEGNKENVRRQMFVATYIHVPRQHLVHTRYDTRAAPRTLDTIPGKLD